MSNNIISYIEMCTREGASLQRDMNFKLGGQHSVILMSLRANAPYKDRVEEEGTVLIYEGHDQPKTHHALNAKLLNQLAKLPSGKLTQNGKFFQAAQAFKNGVPPEQVRVYEKIRDGIWSYNGIFHLVDSWTEFEDKRNVFKFKLIAVPDDLEDLPTIINFENRRRIIPTEVKLEVWKRDGGKCIKCGASDELHFDHILPFAKGGTSLTSANVQLLCARHNIQKSDKLE